MVNYIKNVLVGIGGKDMINKSYFFGVVVGMESIMGCVDIVVWCVLNYGFSECFLYLLIYFILIVME